MKLIAIAPIVESSDGVYAPLVPSGVDSYIAQIPSTKFGDPQRSHALVLCGVSRRVDTRDISVLYELPDRVRAPYREISRIYSPLEEIGRDIDPGFNIVSWMENLGVIFPSGGAVDKTNNGLSWIDTFNRSNNAKLDSASGGSPAGVWVEPWVGNDDWSINTNKAQNQVGLKNNVQLVRQIVQLADCYVRVDVSFPSTSPGTASTTFMGVFVRATNTNNYYRFIHKETVSASLVTHLNDFEKVVSGIVTVLASFSSVSYPSSLGVSLIGTQFRIYSGGVFLGQGGDGSITGSGYQGLITSKGRTITLTWDQITVHKSHLFKSIGLTPGSTQKLKIFNSGDVVQFSAAEAGDGIVNIDGGVKPTGGTNSVISISGYAQVTDSMDNPISGEREPIVGSETEYVGSEYLMYRSINVSDTTSPTDNVNADQLSYVRFSVFDTRSVTEQVTVRIVKNISISDLVIALDSVAVVIPIKMLLPDQVLVSDSSIVETAKFSTVFDGLLVDELINVDLSNECRILETVILTDLASVFMVYNIKVQDTISLVDSFMSNIPMCLLVQDTLDIIDQVEIVLVMLSVAQDNISVIDQIYVAVTDLDIRIVDEFLVEELAIVSYDLFPEIFEMESPDEVLVCQVDILIDIAEAFVVDEFAGMTDAQVLLVLDNILVTDRVSFVLYGVMRELSVTVISPIPDTVIQELTVSIVVPMFVVIPVGQSISLSSTE